MTITELKSYILDLARGYWAGATVVWENNEKVKPAGSLVTLRLDTFTHTRDAISLGDEDDPYFEQQCSASLTVQLFTHGEKITTESGATYCENTACEDLMDFVRFMQSVYVHEKTTGDNVAFLTNGGVTDLTAVIDPNYEYRAMCEFEVRFVQTMRGRAGISRTPWAQTPSGGGTQELADMSIYTIEKAEVEESSDEDNTKT